jgi:hypothetical protein
MSRCVAGEKWLLATSACGQDLVDVHYPHAEQIVLVMDNPITHTQAHWTRRSNRTQPGVWRTSSRFIHRPKRAGWLNMAETELSVLRRQCLDRRIPDRAVLLSEVSA